MSTEPLSPQPKDDARSMGRGMLVLFWILVLLLLTWGFGLWEKQTINPNQSPTSRSTNAYNEVLLESNRQHHYVASGKINQQPVTFLLDTGATDVVVPQQLAHKLGLKAGLRQTAITANGTVNVYSTTIDTLQLGSITLYNIDASINPGMNGEAILLGMSALRNIEFSQRQGQLILRQSADAQP